MENSARGINTLEEAARRTCDFEATASIGNILPHDKEFVAAINKLHSISAKYNRYFIFYTHRFDLSGGAGGNALITPNDRRFTRVELLGMLIDMIQDYADNTGWELKGSKELDATIKILKDIYEGKIDD